LFGVGGGFLRKKKRSPQRELSSFSRRGAKGRLNLAWESSWEDSLKKWVGEENVKLQTGH